MSQIQHGIRSHSVLDVKLVDLGVEILILGDGRHAVVVDSATVTATVISVEVDAAQLNHGSRGIYIAYCITKMNTLEVVPSTSWLMRRHDFPNSWWLPLALTKMSTPWSARSRLGLEFFVDIILSINCRICAHDLAVHNSSHISKPIFTWSPDSI